MKLALFLSVLTCLLFANLSIAIEAGDLVFYFPFEQVNGNILPDMSGNGFDGEINGKFQIVDGGKFGKAGEFQSGDFIDLHGADVPEEKIPTKEMTLCAWINCKKTGGDHAIFNARASDQTWLIHPEAKSSGDFRWLLRTDGGGGIFDIRAGAVDWENWQHYAGTYDGKKGILYINGEAVGEGNGGARIAKDWGSGARIGYNIDNARPFTGFMDDLNMWRIALTVEEIKTVMEKGPEVLIKGEAVSPAGNMTATWGKLKSR